MARRYESELAMASSLFPREAEVEGETLEVMRRLRSWGHEKIWMTVRGWERQYGHVAGDRRPSRRYE